MNFLLVTINGFSQGSTGNVYPGNGVTYFGLNTETDNVGTTSFGDDAGGLNSDSGSYNTFIGAAAGDINKASKNVFTGFQAGFVNGFGASNVFTGYKAGYANTSGDMNVFIGSLSALSLSGESNNNVFIGNEAGRNITTSTANTIIGANAGLNSSGSGNVFLGAYAGYSETSSNRLYVDNSNTTTPLIYGKFDTNQVGINTTNIPSDFAFAIKGKMITEEVKVALNPSSSWPDFVFNEKYSLPSLKAVEKHIKEKGHLQNIPSAEEVSENGFFLGDMNAKLLLKIEELTLYAIQHQKELELEKEKNMELENRLNKLEILIKNIK